MGNRTNGRRWSLSAALFFVVLTLAPASWAIEVGNKAPDFTLPSTTGEKIGLSQFRDKKIVLLEFYGADFTPV